MKLSEEYIEYLEQQIPAFEKLATRQGFLQTLASGNNVTISEESDLVEIYPDSTKKVNCHIASPHKVLKRKYVIC